MLVLRFRYCGVCVADRLALRTTPCEAFLGKRRFDLRYGLLRKYHFRRLTHMFILRHHLDVLHEIVLPAVEGIYLMQALDHIAFSRLSLLSPDYFIYLFLRQFVPVVVLALYPAFGRFIPQVFEPLIAKAIRLLVDIIEVRVDRVTKRTAHLHAKIVGQVLIFLCKPFRQEHCADLGKIICREVLVDA
ncbi:MAG: hypothetical protein HS105_10935 [Chloracidobacterium sp.]|nr:hypothetical protein [Chloracidobacterium sp.]MCO5332834.1 hypothetical protein [Pyrinomonadaceae bacterium]